MTARGARPPARRKPAALALHRPRPLSVPRLAADSTLHDTVRGILGASVLRFLDNAAGVWAGDDPEAVHQARVATRRMRSDLRTLAPLLDAEWVDSLRTQLQSVAAELGEVRDSDVMIAGLESDASLLGEPDAARRVLRGLRSSRTQHRARLLETLDGSEYRRLLTALQDAAEDPRIVGDGEEPAAAVLPALVRRSWRRLRRRVDALPKEPDDDQLHQVRIAAKRARYAAEAVSPVIGAPADRFARRVEDLQTHLGDLHDAVVAAEWLRRHRNSGEDAFVVGALLGVQLQRAAQLRGSWRAVWTRSRRSSLRRWM